jgi:hypothetical protein
MRQGGLDISVPRDTCIFGRFARVILRPRAGVMLFSQTKHDMTASPARSLERFAYRDVGVTVRSAKK